jgi:hypothetical protein
MQIEALVMPISVCGENLEWSLIPVAHRFVL